LVIRGIRIRSRRALPVLGWQRLAVQQPLSGAVLDGNCSGEVAETRGQDEGGA
jgi:hypothetical protein